MTNFHIPSRPKLRGIAATLPHVNRIRAMGGIWFLDLGFSEPTPFDIAHRQSCGGIYVIMVSDTRWGPRQYRPIYFGKAGNFAERVCLSHEKYADWVRASGGSLLFAAFHFATQERERATAERRLISYYKPQCNVTFNNLATLADLMGR